MLQPPQLPLTVRAGNTVMAAMRPLGFQRHALDKKRLMSDAVSLTGLDDFGGKDFEEGLELLTSALNDEARLTGLGRVIARQEVLAPLVNRLRLVDHHKRFPEIGEQTVDAPIFIIGQGRSGTTVLHELLALDPQFRVPQTWEVDQPFPPPDAASYASDPRIAESQRTLDRTDLIMPHFKSIHRTGAVLPQECVRFTTGVFLSLIYWCSYDIPSYARWLRDSADMAPAYRYHRQYLQVLQWKNPRAPWVLKSPAHLWSLGDLLQEYPDARFIQTHRDPLRMLASLTSLVVHLRKMSSNHVDPAQVAREWAVWNALGLNASARYRSEGNIPQERIVDLDFYQFMADPLAEVVKIYDAFDLELTPSTRQAMQNYLASNTSDQHGAHRYTFADTGLDLAQERERVSEYQAYFATREEVS